MKIYVRINFPNEKDRPNDFPVFFPEATNTPWDAVEIHLILEVEKGVCEVVAEGEESFWSVYLQQIDGGVKCVADVSTKVDAELLADIIEQCSNTRIHTF